MTTADDGVLHDDRAVVISPSLGAQRRAVRRVVVRFRHGAIERTRRRGEERIHRRRGGEGRGRAVGRARGWFGDSVVEGPQRVPDAVDLQERDPFPRTDGGISRQLTGDGDDGEDVAGPLRAVAHRHAGAVGEPDDGDRTVTDADVRPQRVEQLIEVGDVLVSRRTLGGDERVVTPPATLGVRVHDGEPVGSGELIQPGHRLHLRGRRTATVEDDEQSAIAAAARTHAQEVGALHRRSPRARRAGLRRRRRVDLHLRRRAGERRCGSCEGWERRPLGLGFVGAARGCRDHHQRKCGRHGPTNDRFDPSHEHTIPTVDARRQRPRSRKVSRARDVTGPRARSSATASGGRRGCRVADPSRRTKSALAGQNPGSVRVDMNAV